MTTIAMLDGARIRIQAPGGKFGEESQPAVGAINVGEAGEHVVQNTGETPFQLFALDRLRPHGQSAPPPGNTSMTVAAESPSFRVLEATLTDKNTQITHIHPVPAVTVLVSGKVLSQGPESKEADIGQAPTGLKQLDQRAQWLFVPAGGSHYLVRLGTEPAHVIEIELR
jgi:hypothetical protein